MSLHPIPIGNSHPASRPAFPRVESPAQLSSRFSPPSEFLEAPPSQEGARFPWQPAEIPKNP